MAGPTSKQVFASSPQQLCTTIDVTDEANQIRYHYSVQVRVTLGQQLMIKHQSSFAGHTPAGSANACAHAFKDG